MIARCRAVHVVALALLLLAGLRCTTESSEQRSTAPAFQETLRLGSDDPDAPDHRLFTQVAAVAVGQDSTIYAVDSQNGGIRVYDADGTFRRTIGQRGQGPGEFERVSVLHVDRQGRLLVADPARARVTAFAPSGRLLTTYSVPEVQRIVQIADLSGGRYAIVGAGKGHLVHVVDSGFSTVEARLVPEKSVRATEHKLSTVITPYFPGSVAVLTDGRLVYAPGFYTGTLRVFAETDTAWTRTATYESPGGRNPPVTITALDDAERVDLPLRMQSGQFAAQLHAVSGGLYTPEGKDLVHVFTQEGDAGLELTVERFTKEGNRRWATVVDTTSTLVLTPLTMDAEGDLYLSDTRDVSQLRRLSWETRAQP